jgi:hypothetical protein
MRLANRGKVTRPNNPQLSPWTDGNSYGDYTVQWSENGLIQLVSGNLQMQPGAASLGGEDGSVLVTSTAGYSGNIAAEVTLKTIAQLRIPTAQNGSAKPYEVAWFLWNYTDNNHFYAITLEPGGWVLSKQNPSSPTPPQQFLASGTTPSFPIGTNYDVLITQTGGAINVSVNGTALVGYNDPSPYTSGKIGLYCETCSAQYGPVQVNGSYLVY